MAEKNKRKEIIYLTIGVVTLLVLVAGATYAYFQAQVGDGKEANLNATTGTTDVLSFLMSDINVSKDSVNIEDNHNREGEQENAEIVINASQDNFGENDKSLGDGVSAKAILKANNETNIASDTYNVYFVMNQNNLGYTKGPDYPELILTVIDPEGKELENIPGLKSHKKDENNLNDVDGFDITGKTKAFAIAQDYSIEVTPETKGGQTEQEWQIKVTLVNFPDTNQNNNTNKEITGRVVITTGSEKEVYTLPHINTITPKTTSSSIEATLDVDEGTNGIKEYYFAIEKKGEVETTALSKKAKEEIDNWQMEKENHHTFNGLDDNTNYIIYSYVIDNENFSSEIYETDLIPTDVVLPQVTGVEVTEKTYNSITINVTTEPGSLPIESYEYSISGERIEGEKITENSNSTYTFEGLEEKTEYTIKVRVKDNKNNYSTEYTPEKVTTSNKTIGVICQGQELGKCVAENYERDGNIIYHNLADATSKKIVNASLVADDNSYRYAGASDVVNNYICFGGTCSSDSNDDNYANLYRIIGLFDDDKDGIYNLKIIKADYATETELGDSSVGANAADSYSKEYLSKSRYKGKLETVPKYYWNKGQNSSGDETSDWSKSNLNNKNLNGYYLNTYLQNKDSGKWNNMIENHEWTTAGTTKDNITNQNAKKVYENEIEHPNKGNFSVAATVTQEVGLMYISDYMYGASQENWTTIAFDNDGNDYRLAIDNNWLYMGLSEWTISRHSNYNNGAFVIGGAGSIYDWFTVYNIDVVVRPVMYLKSDVKITSGSGTIDNPYIISQ